MRIIEADPHLSLSRGTFALAIEPGRVRAPKPLAQFLAGQGVRTAESLLPYLSRSYAALAIALGWELSEVQEAAREVFRQARDSSVQAPPRPRWAAESEEPFRPRAFGALRPPESKGS